jgi:putative transposase
MKRKGEIVLVSGVGVCTVIGEDRNGDYVVRKFNLEEEFSVPPESVSPLPKEFLQQFEDAAISSINARKPPPERTVTEKDKIRHRAIEGYESGVSLADSVKASGVSRARFYQLLDCYDPDLGVLSILTTPRGRKKGTAILVPEVEALISKHYKAHYVGTSPTIQAVWEAVVTECETLNLDPPSYSVVRARINSFSEKDKERRRHGSAKANDKFTLMMGKRDLVDPLAEFQIDHTVCDVFICDEKRRVVGRPYLTLVISTASRIIMGFYIGMRAPSLASVAHAMRHAVLSKTEFMKKLGLEDLSYPYYGVPYTVLSDNAKEFHSANYKRACDNNDIKYIYRTKKQDGGLVERVLGTMNFGIVHFLPGATSWRPEKLRDYDPEKDALVTYAEFVRYFTAGVVKYHNKMHSGLEEYPSTYWNEWYSAERVNALPRRTIRDVDAFQKEILPEKEPKVKTSGVIVNRIYYGSAALKYLVGKKVRVKWDGLNLYAIWAWINESWIEIPSLRKSTHPATLEEWNLRSALQDPKGTINSLGKQARRVQDQVLEGAKKMAKRLRRTQEASRIDAEHHQIAKGGPGRHDASDERDFTKPVEPLTGDEE